MKRPPDLCKIVDDFDDRIKPFLVSKGINKSYSDDYDLILFSQTWGSTALGFSGIGGQAITSAYTTVVIHEALGVIGVYFNEGYAYTVLCPTEAFIEDLKKHNLSGVRGHSKYERTDEGALEFRKEFNEAMKKA